MTPQPRPSRSFQDLSGLGQMLTWVSGLILAISAFTDWYVGSGPGPTTSVIGWHTGALGKLVFVIGLAVLALVILREAGIELPATVPESLVIIALGETRAFGASARRRTHGCASTSRSRSWPGWLCSSS